MPYWMTLDAPDGGFEVFANKITEQG